MQPTEAFAFRFEFNQLIGIYLQYDFLLTHQAHEHNAQKKRPREEGDAASLEAVLSSMSLHAATCSVFAESVEVLSQDEQSRSHFVYFEERAGKGGANTLEGAV
jgi:hypothetical protein